MYSVMSLMDTLYYVSYPSFAWTPTGSEEIVTAAYTLLHTFCHSNALPLASNLPLAGVCAPALGHEAHMAGKWYGGTAGLPSDMCNSLP